MDYSFTGQLHECHYDEQIGSHADGLQLAEHMYLVFSLNMTGLTSCQTATPTTLLFTIITHVILCRHRSMRRGIGRSLHN